MSCEAAVWLRVSTTCVCELVAFFQVRDVSRLVAQHAQTRDRGRAIDADRDHVLRRPCDQARAHARSIHRKRSVVDRKALTEPGLRKRRRGMEIDIDERAAAAVIGVALEEAVAGRIAAVDVDAIDLEADLRGRRPHQRAHAAVADRHTLFAARDGLFVSQIGARDELLVIDAHQRLGGGGVGWSWGGNGQQAGGEPAVKNSRREGGSIGCGMMCWILTQANAER